MLARPMSVGTALAGTGVVLLALLVGVVIGNSGDGKSATPVAAARPQVITVATAGRGHHRRTDLQLRLARRDDGYTVQLQVLSKDGSDAAAVAAAKSTAQGKGAGAVGALDSDDFASLDSGNYVVYSGVFKSKDAAKKALKKLKGDFPGATVVQVSASGGSGGAKKVEKSKLKELESSSPKDYQKKSKKLPDKLKLPGKPPPKDNKKAGGGSKEQTIG